MKLAIGPVTPNLSAASAEKNAATTEIVGPVSSGAARVLTAGIMMALASSTTRLLKVRDLKYLSEQRSYHRKGTLTATLNNINRRDNNRGVMQQRQQQRQQFLQEKQWIYLGRVMQQRHRILQ